MNASRGSSPTTRNPSLSSFYSYKNTFDANTVWCDIPRQRKYLRQLHRGLHSELPSVTFFNTTNPYLDPGTPEIDGQMRLPRQISYAQQHQAQWNVDQQFDTRPELHSHGLEALSAAALYSPPQANTKSQRMSNESSQFDHPFDPSPPVQHDDHHSTLPGAAMSSSNNLNFLLNPASAIDSPIDPSLMSSGLDQASPSNGTSHSPKTKHEKRADGEAESEQKVAHLLRHFSKSPGQWCAG